MYQSPQRSLHLLAFKDSDEKSAENPTEVCDDFSPHLLKVLTIMCVILNSPNLEFAVFQQIWDVFTIMSSDILPAPSRPLLLPMMCMLVHMLLPQGSPGSVHFS